LRIAFVVGREQGYVRIPFFKPQTLARLCALALDSGIEVDYVRDLIRKLDLTPPGDGRASEQWPWPVKVRTLGDFALWVNGAIVEWPRKAQQRPVDLLRVLISYGGRGVAASKLVDELWPDALGDAAASALKTTLHRLRKIFHREDAVLLRDGKLSLNPACVWVDTWALEQLLAELDTAVSRSNNDRELKVLETTAARFVGLYKGPFLDGNDLPCAAPLRQALHRRFLLAIERIGAAFEAMGMSDRARDCYAHGLALDPTAERIHRRLTACATDG
jgi:two-component SAPR family response regulator